MILKLRKKKIIHRRCVLILAVCLLGIFTGCNGSKEQVHKKGGCMQETDFSNYSGKVDLMARRVNEILEGMSLEEKVGQMFFICYQGEAADTLESYHVGGILLFENSIQGKTEAGLTGMLQEMQNAVSIPLFIGVDEEGGSVVRVSSNANLRGSRYKSPQAIFQAGGMTAIKEDTLDKAMFLKNLGINVNFAPVCDVSTNPGDFIYSRSFGLGPQETGEYVEHVVTVMGEQRIGSVLKHFPGYGNNADTHTGIAYDSRTYDTFLESDLIPFQAGIEGGADCVLVSHNIVACMDDSLPASLSPKVHDILRNTLGFQGVVITDDLNMSGISDFTSENEATLLAIEAGNDMLLTPDYKTQIETVLQAVEQGEITEERIDESVFRILMWKMKLGLLEEVETNGENISG